MSTARAHRKFAIYSGFLDTILEGEEEILEGETRKDTLKRILKDLEDTAAELRAEHEQRTQGVPLPDYAKYRHTDVFMPELTKEIPIISKDYERMEIEIDNASTLEELDAVLNRYVTFPGKLLPQINAKRKSLKALDI